MKFIFCRAYNEIYAKKHENQYRFPIFISGGVILGGCLYPLDIANHLVILILYVKEIWKEFIHNSLFYSGGPQYGGDQTP